MTIFINIKQRELMRQQRRKTWKDSYLITIKGCFIYTDGESLEDLCWRDLVTIFIEFWRVGMDKGKLEEKSHFMKRNELWTD